MTRTPSGFEACVQLVNALETASLLARISTEPRHRPRVTNLGRQCEPIFCFVHGASFEVEICDSNIHADPSSPDMFRCFIYDHFIHLIC
jgi:hypothetical protein